MSITVPNKLPSQLASQAVVMGNMRNMADALTVQSYYESILQASGVDYDLVSISANGAVSIPSASMSLIQSHVFDYDVKSCVLFITAYSSPLYVCQYVPLGVAPTYQTMSQYFYITIPQDTNVRMLVHLHDNTLDFYGACTASIARTVSIAPTVALVVKA